MFMRTQLKPSFFFVLVKSSFAIHRKFENSLATSVIYVYMNSTFKQNGQILSANDNHS